MNFTDKGNCFSCHSALFLPLDKGHVGLLTGKPFGRKKPRPQYFDSPAQGNGRNHLSSPQAVREFSSL